VKDFNARERAIFRSTMKMFEALTKHLTRHYELLVEAGLGRVPDDQVAPDVEKVLRNWNSLGGLQKTWTQVVHSEVDPSLITCRHCAGMGYTTQSRMNIGCMDCGSFASEYEVTSQVWEEAGSPHGWVCLTCLSRRLKRDVSVEDLTTGPLNDSIRFFLGRSVSPR